MTTKDKDRRRTFDAKLVIQLLGIVTVGTSLWYADRVEAAVTRTELKNHVNNAVVHQTYEQLAEDFIPRGEVELLLEVIKNDVRYIKDNMPAK